jgi:hypothetical protein
MIGFMVNDPGVFGVVAERDHEILGSNFLDERDPIAGVGPIAVDPETQGGGVGRRLMEAVNERGREAPGRPPATGRAQHGLDAALCITRLRRERADRADPRCAARARPAGGFEVRPLEMADLPACEQVCLAVHGFERTNELKAAAGAPMLEPVVVLREGRITGYATSVTNWALGHAVAESEEDLKALLLGGHLITGDPIDFLLPTRQAGLFRWCLQQGLRVRKPLTLMAMGAYQEPRGAWFPTIAY